MINVEYRDFKKLEEVAIQEKLKKLEKYAVDLCMVGYDVTINLENSVNENDFEMIIRKRSIARRARAQVR